ncbi:MAG: sodium:proton antiporter [Clostridiales bacterium]|nr:sodium:proton antiporter [Clostridiales bacterium]
MFKGRSLRITLITALVFICGSLWVFASGDAHAAGEITHHNLGEHLPLWSCIPFVGMLLSIAIFPLVKPHWWEHNMLKVALIWALIFLIPFGIVFGGHLLAFSVVEAVILDYVPFIVLLFGLFVAAGGIVVKGSIIGTTKTNLVLLIIGTVLASWLGTTGAAMLMIRPVIRANAWRKRKAHVIIFFIFMVANIGGCLTPVGDPPLFLGFLRGVPFFWTMQLFPVMIVNIVILLVVFFILDKRMVKKDMAEGFTPESMMTEKKEKISVEGAHNFIFIAMIVGAVVLSGILASQPAFIDASGAAKGINIAGAVFPYNYLVQVIIILIAALLSWKTTKKITRERNSFTFGPIAEVAKLFIGIFLTMIPALAILRSNGASLGLEDPAQFFWITGALSSFLDNAPTYLVFLTTAGSLGATAGVATTVGTVAAPLLLAVSCGAVFMGANTYIGNAPNFMVKSIAEENKIKMPSFFGYMKWSVCILIPIFLIDTLIFFL